VAVWVCWVER